MVAVKMVKPHADITYLKESVAVIKRFIRPDTLGAIQYRHKCGVLNAKFKLNCDALFYKYEKIKFCHKLSFSTYKSFDKVNFRKNIGVKLKKNNELLVPKRTTYHEQGTHPSINLLVCNES